jgi:predicted N-formylglutamate amidohydrolase
MTTPDSASLLDRDEPEPTRVFNSGGSSPFLILGDHAGNFIPKQLGTLGLSAENRERHIAWDIGVRGLGELLATALDATFIHQYYSRLVIDCNRDPAAAEAIPETSDGSCIPGNASLSDDDRAARVAAIHDSYHDRIAKELVIRSKADRLTILIALHSFTPVMGQIDRPWHVGVLYSEGNTGFATTLLDVLERQSDITTGDNEPYQMDQTDHTIPRHGFVNSLPYAELEIRQDLIADPMGQRIWCFRLSAALEAALQNFRAIQPSQ